MELWLTGKTTPPAIKKKGIVGRGEWNKIISSAENTFFVVELEHLWEFTSINVKEKNKNKGEGNFKIIVVAMKVSKQ